MIRIPPGRDKTRETGVSNEPAGSWSDQESLTPDLLWGSGSHSCSWAVWSMHGGWMPQNERARWGADHQYWSTLATHRFLFNSSRVWTGVALRAWKSLAKLNISIMVPRFNLKGLTWIFEAQINHKGLSWDLEEIKKYLRSISSWEQQALCY